MVVRRMLDGQIESTRYLRNPLDVLAQQIVAHAAQAGRASRSPTLAALVRRSANFAELSDEQFANTLDLLAGRYPSEEFSELRPRVVWNRVTDTRAGPATAPSAWPSRRAARSPTAGCSGCSCPTAPGSASSTRRWSTRAGPGRRSCSARRRGASRTSRSRRSPSRRRRASRGRCRSGTATGRVVRSSWGGRSARSCARSASCSPAKATKLLRQRLRPRRAGGRQRPPVRRRAGRVDRRGARRPHDRRRALPRRDRRLAGVPAQPVRHAGARPVGDGHRAPADRPVRHAGGVDVGRRRHRAAAARGGRRAAARRRDDRPRGHRGDGRGHAAADRAVLLPVPGVRRPGPAAAAPAARPAHPACGSSARRPPTCWPWPPSTRRSRSCWRRRGSACRTSSTCRRCARCSGSCAAGRCASSPSTRPSPARWPRACCSTGSPRTCTRATRRWPSAGPPPSPSTATCCATSSAPRSCASCSIPGVLADVELDLQRLSDGRRARSADELHDVLRRRRRPIGGRARPALRVRPSHEEWLAELVAEKRADRGHRGGRDALGGRRRRGPLPRCARLRAAARAARRRSPSPCRGRWRTSSGATPARTARSSSARSPTGFGVPEGRVAGVLMALEADGRIVRGEFRPEGRQAGVVRGRRAAPAAPTLAGHAAARGRAGRGRGAGPLPARAGTASPPSDAGSTPSSRRSACWPARRSWPRRWRSTC